MFASTAAANPIPVITEGPVLTQTPMAIPTIDAALAELRQAKSMADLDTRVKTLLADVQKKYETFVAEFNGRNPERCNTAPDGQRFFRGSNFDQQAFNIAYETQKKACSAYYAQRAAYPEPKKNEYLSLVAAITDFQRAAHATAGESSGRRNEALGVLSGVTGPGYRNLVTFQTVAPEVERLAATVAAMKKPDGYAGYTRLSFPKWEGDAYAVRSYVGTLAARTEALLPGWQTVERNCAETKTSLARTRQALALDLAELNKNLLSATLLVADYGLGRDAAVASKLATTESEVGALRKRADGAEQAGKKADEECTRLQATAAENIANIQNDVSYLTALLKKIEYWNDIITNEKYGGAAVVSVGIVTEGGSGTRRKFLAPSRSDLSLFDKAKANATADALLQDIQRTGIAKWDPQDATGLRKLLEAKAVELRTYAVDAPDWEIVDCCVVYASRITKMANDVRAIPTSSYGSMTYAQGIKNRTFDKDLGAALRNGTAFAMDLSLRTDSNTQQIAVTTAALQKVASSAKNAAVRGAASEVAKAIGEQLNRYNPQVEQENKKFKEDAAKLEKDLAAWNECANKNPGRGPQVCGNPPSASGTAGGTATATTTAAAPTQPPPTSVPTGVPGGTPTQAGPPGGQGRAPGVVQGGTPGTAAPGGPVGAPAGPPQGVAAPGGQPGGAQPVTPQAMSAGGQGGSGPAGVPQPMAQSGQSRAQTGPPQGMTTPGGQTGGAQSAPPPGMSAGGQSASGPAGGPQQPSAASAPPTPASPPISSPSMSGAAPMQPPAAQRPAASAMTTPPAATNPGAGGFSPSASAPGSMPGGAPGGMPSAAPGGTSSQAARPGAGPGPGPGAPGAQQLAFAQSAPQQPDQAQAIRELYQKFAEAYQRKDVRGVTKWLSPKWTSASGGSSMELEETLGNSFRVFDTIQFQIQGLQIQKASDTEYKASYTALLTGRINRNNLRHEDKASVTDTVAITPEGPRITKTSGNNLWNKK